MRIPRILSLCLIAIACAGLVPTGADAALIVEGSPLDFGLVVVGDTEVRNFRITNTGSSPESGVLTVTGDGFYVPEGTGHWYARAGDYTTVSARFTPTVAGERFGTADFGNPLCGDGYLRGVGIEPSDQDDLIGIYFEQSGTVNTVQTTEPYEEVTAYLMIVNPTTVTGIRGWECCIEMEGDGEDLQVQLHGEALNIDEEPCFVVGMIRYALDGDYLVTLATIRFTQPSPDSVTRLYIRPGTKPSVPDVTCYIDGVHEGQKIPLGWTNGNGTLPVAIVNDPSTSGVDGPPVLVRDLGNYPNPFNPGTTISFVLGADAPVSLALYDVSGRAVRTLLVGESLAVGRNEVSWDGRDESGRLVAAGVYFYRIDAGEYRETKRMMLVK